MGLMNRWALLLSTIIVAIGYVKWRETHPVPPNFRELPAIKRLINRSLAENRRICVNTGPFPFDTGDPPAWRPGLPISGSDFAVCKDCEKLVQDGLLSRTDYDGTTDGRTRTFARYELTNLGQSTYREEIRNLDVLSPTGSGATGNAASSPAIDSDDSIPGFCFADKVVLHEVVDALPPMGMGASRFISVKYTVEAVNPSPFLFDPRLKLLNLQAPKQGTPALYPPQITTLRTSLRFDPSNPGELDPTFRYGRWVNE